MSFLPQIQEAALDADKLFLAAIDKFSAMMSRSNDYAPEGMQMFFFSYMPVFKPLCVRLCQLMLSYMCTCYICMCVLVCFVFASYVVFVTMLRKYLDGYLLPVLLVRVHVHILFFLFFLVFLSICDLSWCLNS